EQIMDKIAVTGASPGRSITVTGHTDDVPLSGGSYGDNFGLAAARAASVVRALIDSGEVDPAQIAAVSKGEFAPVADNATEEGRARNRRIDVDIDNGE
ncbi:MAG: flagellar motor protein MotB, partial [Gemmobacter sp.]